MISLSLKKTIFILVIFFCLIFYINANYFIKNDMRYISFLFFLPLLFYANFNSIKKIGTLWQINIFFVGLLIGSIFSKFILNGSYTFFPHLISFSTFYIGLFFFDSLSKEKLLSFIYSYYNIIKICFLLFIVILIFNYRYNFFLSGFQTHYSFFGIILCIPNSPKLIKLLFLILSFISLFLIKKNSAIIILLLWILFYLYKSTNKVIKKTMILFYLLLFLFLINNFYVIIDFKENLLPEFSTGNINTRSIMYQSSIDKFIESPLYGNFFMDSPLIDYHYFAGRDLTDSGYVPIHNDILEILSNGGIFFLVLFLYSVIAPFYYKNKIDESLREHYLIFYFSFIMFIFSSFFNPLFSLPVLSFFCFFNFSLVYSIYFKTYEKQ